MNYFVKKKQRQYLLGSSKQMTVKQKEVKNSCKQLNQYALINFNPNSFYICLKIQINSNKSIQVKNMASRRSSLIEQISFNSYADEQQRDPNFKTYRIKIIVLGVSGSGKSTMLYQYTHQRNPRFQNPTIGTDFVSKVQEIQGIDCHLQIWDTADYRSPSIPNSLYNGALGFVIVYDITKKSTFDPVYSIMNDLAQKGDRQKQIFLIGNKKDLVDQDPRRREIKIQQVMNFARNRRLSLKEVSSYDYQQVERIFRGLAERIVQKVNRGIIKSQQVQKQAIRSGRVIISGQGFQKRYNRCC